MHFIPRDYVLDGSSKISVIFGKRHGGKPQRYTMLGVTVRHIEDFDIEHYMTLSVLEQQEIILSVLSSTMIEVARSSGADLDVIQRAADAVRECGFATEIEIKKLSRSSKDHKFRIKIFRRLGPDVGEIWEARIYLSDGSLLATELISSKPDWLDRTDHFSKSQWSGDVFQIAYSRLDKINYQLDMSKFRE